MRSGVLLVIPLALLISMSFGEFVYWLFVIGAFVIYIIASSLSAVLFPLEVKRYESSFTELNITK
jgi:hypothetical protein